MREWEEQHEFDEASAEAISTFHEIMELTGKLVEVFKDQDVSVVTGALVICVSLDANIRDDREAYYKWFMEAVKNRDDFAQLLTAMAVTGEMQ